MQVSDTRLQYRITCEKTFVIELEWPADYPNIPLRISLDVFYNSHVPEVSSCSCPVQVVSDFELFSSIFGLFFQRFTSIRKNILLSVNVFSCVTNS